MIILSLYYIIIILSFIFYHYGKFIINFAVQDARRNHFRNSGMIYLATYFMIAFNMKYLSNLVVRLPDYFCNLTGPNLIKLRTPYSFYEIKVTE